MNNKENKRVKIDEELYQYSSNSEMYSNKLF